MVVYSKTFLLQIFSLLCHRLRDFLNRVRPIVVGVEIKGLLVADAKFKNTPEWIGIYIMVQTGDWVLDL